MATKVALYREFWRRGFTPLPVRNKVPQVRSWKALASGPVTPAQVTIAFLDKDFDTIGLICRSRHGRLGHFAGIDVDDKNADKPVSPLFLTACEETFPDLFAKFLIATTPSGGRHVYFLTASGHAKQVLARSAEGGELIAFCGEGTLMYVAPGPGRKVLQGKYSTLPVLTDEQVRALIEIGRRFDQSPPSPPPPPKKRRTDYHSGSPWDWYNAAHSCHDVLTLIGYEFLGERGGLADYLRPGSTARYTCQVKLDEDVCFNWSTSVPIPVKRPRTPFDLYCDLHHSGDYAAASLAVRRMMKNTPIL